MSIFCNVQVSFQVATAEDVTAALDAMVCPDGAQVIVGVNESIEATVPEGGGAPALDSDLSL